MSDFDVLCIGNAIVDIITRCEEDFLVDNAIRKGAMNLIDADRAAALYDRMGPAVETSGGSAGNTAAGIASFGAKACYFGKVSDDQLGEIFAHDIRAQGVSFDTAPLKAGAPTARSMIFVTPDGERSMNTYLGSCIEFSSDDIEHDKARGAKVTYFEGYLWDPPRAKDAIRLAAKIAHEAGHQVSMTLSDPFCVDRFRDEFLELIQTGTVDFIFANEHELKSLYQTASFEQAVGSVRKDCKFAVVTRSARGSVVVTADDTIEVAAVPVAQIVDTTGAGDLYASGFLYGYAKGLSLAHCARLGSFAAALVIQQLGPRIQTNLHKLARDEGLL